MKLKTLLLAALLISLISISKTSSAQFYLGPKLAFNGYYGSGGGGLEMGTIANEKYKFSLDAIYYFPREVSMSTFYVSQSVKQSFVEANANFSYLFIAGKAYLYPTGGVQIAFVHEEIRQSASNFGGSSYNQNVDFEDMGVGLNIGGGVRFNREGRVSPSLDFKYAISSYSNATFTFTLPINFKKAE
jgi:hypothetical protein